MLVLATGVLLSNALSLHYDVQWNMFSSRVYSADYNSILFQFNLQKENFGVKKKNRFLGVNIIG
jgi:hypothetical protein